MGRWRRNIPGAWAGSRTTRARRESTRRYIQKNFPGKTVGILYQNDDFGKDYLTGFHDAFGKDYAKTIVAEVPYETSAPTVDSLVVQIKDANPDIFVTIGTPKFAAQAIKKIGEMNWHPIQFLTNVAVSIPSRAEARWPRQFAGHSERGLSEGSHSIRNGRTIPACSTGTRS